MKYDLIIENFCGSLGDCLTFTPLIRLKKRIKIILPDINQCRNISKIYDNLFDVEFKDKVGNTLPGESYYGNLGKARLHDLGYKNISGLPIVYISEDEKEKGKQFLNGIKNPVALITNPARIQNCPQNYINPRKINNEFWNKIYDILIKNNYTPIQFGLSSNIDLINKKIDVLLNLSIRDLISVYYNIPNYIGVDTGDYHLMLAVGNKALVFHPDNYSDNVSSYDKNKYHYTENEFENNEIRVKYINKNINVNELDISDLIF